MEVLVLAMKYAAIPTPSLFKSLAKELVEPFKTATGVVNIDLSRAHEARPIHSELRARGYSDRDISQTVQLLIWRSGFRPKCEEVLIRATHGERFLSEQVGRWQVAQLDPTWRRFERVVAVLHDLQLGSPGVRVAHDTKVQGSSGADHQIDVLVEIDAGAKTEKFIVSCKQFARTKVKKSHILEWAGIRDDVGASGAAVVASVGYQKGAKLVAAHQGIHLWRLTEVGSDSWSPRQEPRAIALPIPIQGTDTWAIDNDSWEVQDPGRVPFVFTIADVELESSSGRTPLIDVLVWGLVRQAFAGGTFPRFLQVQIERRAHVPKHGISFYAKWFRVLLHARKTVGTVERPLLDPVMYVLEDELLCSSDAFSEFDILPLLFRIQQ